MDDNLVFVSDKQRDGLIRAYSLIEDIKSQISIEYEEYTAIDTTLYYLERAIKYEEKYY